MNSWRHTKSRRKEFENLFVSQYLTGLRERHSPFLKQPRVISSRRPTIGDLVQIKGDSTNRNTWRVGKISNILRSKDGACRSAHVTLDNGTTLHRSLSHIYPLELNALSPLPPSQPLQDEFTTPGADPGTEPRPRREAAQVARLNIRKWTRAQFNHAVTNLRDVDA